MVKKKIIFTIAGLLLLSGGTVLGTKSWLIDTKDVSNDLVITTGKFDLNIDSASKWAVVNNTDTEINNGLIGNGFTNVRPGDKFEKTVTITNTGTLKQKLTITQDKFLPKDENNTYTDVFEITHNGLEIINEQILDPGQSKSFQITVKTNPDAMIKDKHQDLNIDFKEMINPIIIEGNQVNKEVQQTKVNK